MNKKNEKESPPRLEDYNALKDINYPVLLSCNAGDYDLYTLHPDTEIDLIIKHQMKEGEGHNYEYDLGEAREVAIKA